jgi:hypothetical protein
LADIGPYRSRANIARQASRRPPQEERAGHWELGGRQRPSRRASANPGRRNSSANLAVPLRPVPAPADREGHQRPHFRHLPAMPSRRWRRGRPVSRPQAAKPRRRLARPYRMLPYSGLFNQVFFSRLPRKSLPSLPTGPSPPRHRLPPRAWAPARKASLESKPRAWNDGHPSRRLQKAAALGHGLIHKARAGGIDSRWPL